MVCIKHITPNQVSSHLEEKYKSHPAEHKLHRIKLAEETLQHSIEFAKLILKLNWSMTLLLVTVPKYFSM